MIFNSLEFAFFLPIVFILYWCLNNNLKAQNIFLLLSSYFFYGWWDWRFLLLIVFSSFTDFIIGISISKASYVHHKKILLALSLIVNLGILGFFKYYNFFLESFVDAFSLFGQTLNPTTLQIILPVGISFYTFQTLSYTIDVYQQKLKPTKDIISFFTYVSFFPQLVAGPIERAVNLLPQFKRKRNFQYSEAVAGVNLIIYGLFKKIVVADRLAIYVNQVFNDLDNASTISTFLAIIFFSFQIYCDFSGYSDIARGISKLLGFDLMLNFNRPYFSKSIAEFWKRWHISLSTWFRDYLYIPLGGNRTKKVFWYSNLFIVFLVSGFWHGASWTFIIWGGLHGFFQVAAIITKDFRNSILKKFRITETNMFLGIFNILSVYLLVSFAWIFFRANTVDEAFQVISNLAAFDFSLNLTQICAEKGPLNLLLCFLAIGLLFLSYLLPLNLNISYRRNIVLLTISILLIITLGTNEESQFIYFQF